MTAGRLDTRRAPALGRRAVWLTGAALPALLWSGPQARAGNPAALSPGWFAGKVNSAAASVGAAQSAGSQTIQQLGQVARSLANLQQAAAAIKAVQAAQSAARQIADTSGVPDGLTIGGLQPVAGAVAGSAAWRNAQLPTSSQSGGQTKVTVVQTAAQAVLNWQSFNVGAHTTLAFDQSAGGPSASTWVALNRVSDPAAQPSRILGQITAPGQVYVINHNGVIFGQGAQVNTGGLVVAAADISDDQFTGFGLYSQSTTNGYLPSFTGALGAVTVQAGAQITTNPAASVLQAGGAVILLGSTVSNAGQIITPNGQTILAAGQDFVLRPGYAVSQTAVSNQTSTTRGSEVDPTAGGAVTNTGLIQASTGDITLAGGAVTQAGVLLSTTSVAQRGTIHLLTDTSNTAGQVALAPGSVTMIAPDDSTATALEPQRQAAIADSATANAARQVTVTALLDGTFLGNQAELADLQYQSRIEITAGGSVQFQSGSLTMAQGGQVAVSAGQPQFNALPVGGLVHVAGGAQIDVSGVAGLTLPMSANSLAVNVQGFELRDAPVNRDTTLLNSSTVYLDVRQLTEIPASVSYSSNRYYSAGGLLEVSGEYGNFGHTIQEWSSYAGAINLSAGTIVAQPGSVFNIAGGSITYQPGTLRQSWLIASNGTLYNANTAPSDLRYTGVFNGFTVDHPRWNVSDTYDSTLVAPSEIYQPGYTVGRDAGTLVLNASTAIFQGTIQAGVVSGTQQTAAPTASNTPFLAAGSTDPFTQAQNVVPLGGALLIGSYGASGQASPGPTTVTVSDAAAAAITAPAADQPVPTALVGTATLAASPLNASGLASLAITASQQITTATPLSLAPGGQVSLAAAVTTIGAGITSHGGGVAVTNAAVASNDEAEQLTLMDGSAAITLASGAAIDTSGLWTNLLIDPTHPSFQAFVNGGSVAFSTTGALTLQGGSSIDASSGGTILASGAGAGGAGGNISLSGDVPLLSTLTAGAEPVVLAGSVRSVGVTKGGAFALAAGAVRIGVGSDPLPAGVVALPASFFQQGFSSYSITGYGSVTGTTGAALPGVIVEPGTALSLVMPVYGFTQASLSAPTGSAPATALAQVLPPLYTPNPVTAQLTQRGGASLSLSSATVPGGGNGAVGNGNTGGSVVIGAGAVLTVDPLQKIAIEAYGQITIDGTLRAPGGTISVLNDNYENGTAGVASYVPGQSVWLGGDSVLDVSGQAATALDQYGRPYGVVNPGGTITLGSNGATSVLSAPSSTNSVILIRPGAVVDASGASALIDPAAGLGPVLNARTGTGGVTPGAVLVASNGGAISLSSYNGIFIDGTLRAAAGGPGAAGGTLSIALQTPVYSDQQTLPDDSSAPSTIPDAIRVPHEIVVSQQATPAPLAADLQPGDPNSFASQPQLLGQARLGADQVTAGGFANLSLSTPDLLLFNGPVTLSASQSIRLNQGEIAVAHPTDQVTVAAPYVLLAGQQPPILPDGSYTPLLTASITPTGQFLPRANGQPFSKLPPCLSGLAPCTSAGFTVQADLIDLQNVLRFGVDATLQLTTLPSGKTPTLTLDAPGFNAVTLSSSGDIRFLPNTLYATATNNVTDLATSGSLKFVAGQVYPVTGAVAQVEAGVTPYPTTQGSDVYGLSSGLLYVYAGAGIAIASAAGPVPAPPLSAFGSLTLTAPTIRQGGVLRAPEGQLTLQATGSSTQTPDGGTTTQTAAISLLPGSITSVSAYGLSIPYGGTTDGINYDYAGSIVGTAQAGVSYNAPLTPGLTLVGQSISIASGAVVDLRGGGQLTGGGGETTTTASGAETLQSQGFTSGRGGSTDTLTTPLGTLNVSAATSGAGSAADPVYAVVAGPQPAYAPTSFLDSGGVSYYGAVPTVGQQITLGSGVPGLPAGTYTLLPSYYALLPGGYRVELARSLGTQLPGTVALRNGSYLLDGTQGVANTAIQATQPTAALVTPGATLRTYSQYDEQSYSQFQIAIAGLFGAPRQTPIPADALPITLTYFAAPSLDLPALRVDGAVLTAPDSGGHGVVASITSATPNVGTLGDIELTPAGATPTTGYVSLAAPDVNALHASTLVLGGTQALNRNTVTIASTSDSVVLRNGATLAAPEVFLVGGAGGLTLEPGSTLNTLGQGPTTFDSTDGYVYDTSGSAVVAVSNGSLSLLPPSTGGGGPIGVGACLTGDTCAPGALVHLYSAGTIAFSTGSALTLGTNVRYGASTIIISVPDVNVGTDAALAAATVPAGVQLGAAQLATLLAGDASVGAPALQQLILTATQSLNVYGGVTFSTLDANGQSSLQQLVLNTPAIYGYGASGDAATIGTGTLVWNGLASGTASAPPGPVITGGPGTGSGTLNIDANTILFGYPAGTLPQSQVSLDRLILGFGAVNLTANTEITANSRGTLSVYQSQGAYQNGVGFSHTGGTLSLITPLVTGTPASVLGLTTGGALTLAPPAGVAASTATPAALGAELDLTAAGIADTTAIVLPGGRLAMTAQSGDIVLGSGARTDLSGQTAAFFEQSRDTPGGSVVLESRAGNITQAADASISVAAGQAAAGSVSATATSGTVALEGPISGGADAGFTAGSITVRAGVLPDFAALNQRLNQGGVFASRSFDIKTGDLTIGADAAGAAVLRANAISVSVDGGSLTVAGPIDASGAAPGSISLSAAGDLTLQSGARLDAHGTVLQTDSTGAAIAASNQATISLTSAGGTLSLLPGSTLNLSAADGVARGDLELNAPRVGADDVAINASGGITVQGAGTIAVNAYRSYTPGEGGVTAAGVITQAAINTIGADSTAFIDAAGGNAALLGRLAGLTGPYASGFHLRPGVIIQSSGDLTVSGDLDLSGQRYASLNTNTPLTGTYGSGEPGTLVLRAGGNLNVYGSITDGFSPPPPTPDDNGWVNYTIVEPNGQNIVVGPLGLTLPAAGSFPTRFPNTDVTLSYSVPITANTLVAGAVVPVVPTGSAAVTLSAPVTIPALFYTQGVITTPTATFQAGQAVPAGTVLPAGTTLGTGVSLAVAAAINPVTWPAGASLAAFANGLTLAHAVTLTAGAVLPYGTQIGGLHPNGLATRSTSNGIQGQVWAVASLLPAGDLSWSLQLVGGADLTAADTGIVQPAGVLAATATVANPTPGSVTLADLHYQDPLNTTVKHQEVPSVVRTGTGSLAILAGGNVTEQSLFGVYTAGAQSAGVAAAYDQPRPDLLGTDSVLGSLGDSITRSAGGNTYSYNTAVAGYQANYPTAGGNVLVSAQGNVTGNILVASNSTQIPSSNAVGDWLWWQGGDGTPAAWWINYGTYLPSELNTVFVAGFTGIGALGGGNATVRAGGNIGQAPGDGALMSNAVDVAVASTGQVVNGKLVQSGGGSLTLVAGGDLNPVPPAITSAPVTPDPDLGGTLTAMRGPLTVQAGAVGSIAPGLSSNNLQVQDPRPANPATSEVSSAFGGPILVLGDSVANITTRGDLVLAGAGDPTRLAQQNLAASVAAVRFNMSDSSTAEQSWFSLWQPATAINLLSAGGNITPVVDSLGSFTSANNFAADTYLYPPILTATAAAGSIYYGATSALDGSNYSLELAPSPVGQMAFLAGGSIYAQRIAVDISGADPAGTPTPLSPAYQGIGNTATNVSLTTGHAAAGSLFSFESDTPTTSMHAGDPTPALFYAAAGDIVGLWTGEQVSYAGSVTVPVLQYIAAKPVRIHAGRDLVDIGTQSGGGVGGTTAGLILNDSSTDISTIEAGRDIIYLNTRVAGPGLLYVQAGRNVYQGAQGVLESLGPIVDVNPQSRSGGAGITVLAGVGAAGPDYTDFANLYLNPANLANAATPLQDQPGRVVLTYQTALLSWLQQNTGYTGDAAGALAYFQTLLPQQQASFLLPIYFDELNRGGLDYNDPTSRFFKSYLEGERAIAALFPAGSANQGDMTLYGGSGVRTDAGGGITLLAPNGAVTLGVTSAAAPPATAGVITQGSGDIDIYALGSVLLGQSRIFTTYGGNIVIWSEQGDINAGRGAKSTVVVAPQLLQYDDYGNINLSPSVPTTGAGIATLNPIPSVPPGDVNLVAPNGVIDAGEAGIRASGNANLAALAVLNAANIQVQGKTSGLPAITIPNVAAETAAAAAGGAAEQAAQSAAAQRAQTVLPSIITVEVIGYGGSDATSSP